MAPALRGMNLSSFPGLLGRAEAGGERLAVPGGQPARLLPAAE